jgi:hypothetical protein
MSSTKGDLVQYEGLENYYPEWVKNVADDATLEGSMLDGVIIGREGLQSVVLKIKGLYDHQDFVSVGPYGEHAWIEEYVAEVGGKPLSCVVLVKFNDSGQTQHVVASYRPRTTVIDFARRLADEFAGTPIEEHFRSSGS